MIKLMCTLLSLSLCRPQFEDEEIQARWSVLRSSLAGIHVNQTDRAGHPVNHLNITTHDHAVHQTITKYDPEIKERMRSPVMVAVANFTNPAPLAFPAKHIAHNMYNVFSPRGNASELAVVPTMIPDQEGPLPLRGRETLRPMDTYCKYNDCTTLGNVSKTIGRRIQNMYHASLVGRTQDRIDSAGAAALFFGKRGLIPHELKRASSGPVTTSALDTLQDLVDSAVPDVDRPLAQTAARVSRSVVWDNIDLIAPNQDRRMANTLTRLHLRDMMLCRMSLNTLPYCRANSMLSDGSTNDDDDYNMSDLVPADDESDSITGFTISGVALSCRLQGGCYPASVGDKMLKPEMFERTYFGTQTMRSYGAQYGRTKLSTESEAAEDTKPTLKPYFTIPSLRTPRAVEHEADDPWYLRFVYQNAAIPNRQGAPIPLLQSVGLLNRKLSFDAVIMPYYDNLTKVVEEQLPFLFLNVANATSYQTPSFPPRVDDQECKAFERPRGNTRAQSFKDASNPFNPDNWNKPWLDWYFAY